MRVVVKAGDFQGVTRRLSLLMLLSVSVRNERACEKYEENTGSTPTKSVRPKVIYAKCVRTERRGKR